MRGPRGGTITTYCQDNSYDLDATRPAGPTYAVGGVSKADAATRRTIGNRLGSKLGALSGPAPAAARPATPPKAKPRPAKPTPPPTAPGPMPEAASPGPTPGPAAAGPQVRGAPPRRERAWIFLMPQLRLGLVNRQVSRPIAIDEWRDVLLDEARVGRASVCAGVARCGPFVVPFDVHDL